MATPKLNIAIAGLGRMGSRHANHFYNLTPLANLVAASSPDEKELVWASRALEGVRLYKDYEEMLREEKAKGLQAVVIASATTVHADQAIKAIEMGLHVLCEKPLSTSVEVVGHTNHNSHYYKSSNYSYSPNQSAPPTAPPSENTPPKK